MSTAVEQIVIVDEWRGLYSESWKGVIVDEAFAHPAKFSRALIRKIYDHVIAEGWATKGSSVVDPFGGVALGGFDAMRHGLNWTGSELEEKFVGLGSQNIALWNERFSRMPNWGTARLVRGDSRKLAEVLSAAKCCVSSPPYASGCAHTGGDDPKPEHLKGGAFYGVGISSPPYSESMNRAGGIDASKSEHVGGPHSQMNRSDTRYGSAEGQLGAMPEGDLCVTSPPYNPPMSQDHNGSRGGQRGTTPSEKGAFVKYGTSEGQLEGMSMDGHAIAVSSPPYATGDSAGPESLTTRQDKSAQAMLKSQGWRDGGQVSAGNLAASGETFWSASRLILEQLHQVLAPNTHAVFVVKSFVRDKKIVDFPAQWAQLCEAVGFKLLHDHHALLTEHYGTQRGFETDKTLRVERKSFFRRLAESKGSPRIDHENVLCFQKVE